MDIDDLSPDQLANLSGEQITAIEANPEKIEEILNNQAGKDAERDNASVESSEQEVKEIAANGKDDEVEKKTEKTEEAEPKVLNKSETGFIPYTTLQNTRKDLAEERQKSKQLEQDLADARAAKEEALSKTTELAKAQEDAATPAQQAEADADMEAHLKVLEEDFPEQHAIVKNMMDKDVQQTKTIETLSKRLEKLENQTPTGETVEEMRERLRLESIEAVDNNPDLAYWRDNDPDAFDEADKQDQLLRQNPKWAAKSFDERYVEAVRRTRAIIPDAPKPENMTGKQQKEADLKAQAKKKVDEAKQPEPTTLSDVRGAEGASLSRVEEMDNMDELDLTARLMRMSPEDAAAYRTEGDV